MKIRTRRAQNKHLVDEPVRRNASTAAKNKPARRGDRVKPDSKYFQSNKELRQAFFQRQVSSRRGPQAHVAYYFSESYQNIDKLPL